jgi:regulator of protease activity HflC (stomatin/prohibitin superfamily)
MTDEVSMTEQPPTRIESIEAPQQRSTLQLTQARAPLDDAGEVLGSMDAEGHQPIVLVPLHASRIRNELVVAGLVLLAVAFLVDVPTPARTGSGVLALVLLVLGFIRALFVVVPEGARAVLLRGGRLHATVGPGVHVVRPGIVVSHVVTTRDTPFDAPGIVVPTRDDVRVRLDMLLMFRITAPERFVFAISAADFDEVCQATCREAVRLLVRAKDSAEILDLGEAEAEQLRVAIGERLEPYGTEAVRAVLAHVMPPTAFVASREAQRLARLQRAEEEELHALALLRQSNREALTREQIAAGRAEIELEADNEAARLERLETTIREFPAAMRWDLDSQRLDVARALAANPRALLQVGTDSDVAGALLMQTNADGHPVPDTTRPEGHAPRDPRTPRTRR